MKLTQQSFFLFLLLVIAAMSWWAMTITDPNLDTFTTSKEGPDHYMVNFTATKLSDAGKPVNRLKAERLTHYPNEKHSDVIKPQMTFFKEDGNIWIASANQGKVLGDGKEVFLTDDVNIVRPGPPETKITIHTSDLHVIPAKDYAETKNSIVMQQNENTVTATGMEAFFTLGNIQLISEVRGWYVQ